MNHLAYQCTPIGTPFFKVFELTNNFEQALALVHKDNSALQDLLLSVAKKIHKFFSNKWTNDVLSKLVSVGIVSPDKLLSYFHNSTLHSCLVAGKKFGINPTSIRVDGK